MAATGLRPLAKPFERSRCEGRVAQLVEQRTLNPPVVGSIPTALTISAIAFKEIGQAAEGRLPHAFSFSAIAFKEIGQAAEGRLPRAFSSAALAFSKSWPKRTAPCSAPSHSHSTCYRFPPAARMVELVDTRDLESRAARRTGSNPVPGNSHSESVQARVAEVQPQALTSSLGPIFNPLEFTPEFAILPRPVRPPGVFP